MAGLRVLFVSLTNDFGSDRLVSDLGRAGATCAVLAPPGSFAALPRCVEATFPMPKRWASITAPAQLADRLSRAAARWIPDRIVPLDDLSATLLRTLGGRYDAAHPLGALLRTSFGAPEGFAAASERVALMELAVRAGVRVPPFAAVTGPWPSQRHDALSLPVMVKRDQSSGSGGVKRVEHRRQLAGAVRLGWLKSAAKAQMARAAGLGRRVTPVLVQGVVEGRLAMYTLACRDGRVTDGAGFAAIETHPVKGSSTILRHCPHPEMAEAARRLVAELRCSGFVSFDFIVDAADRAFLIEMNPRPIGSTHLGRLFGHDLARAYVTGVATTTAPMPAWTRDIALFPKELERDPSGWRLRSPGTYHDLPVHEPDVVAAYMSHLLAEHPAHAESLARAYGIEASARASAFPKDVRPEAC